MKRLKLIITLTLIVVILIGCQQIKNYDKPHLELSADNPYVLNISDFTWTYGLTSINSFNGDFDKLDEEIYDLLKGKNGTCQVFIANKNKDKYGNETSESKYIGDINIDELNKYQDWKYWQRNEGIKVVLYNKFIRPNIDSAKMDSTPQIKLEKKIHVDTITRKIDTPKITGDTVGKIM